jgi:hypothetical protein
VSPTSSDLNPREVSLGRICVGQTTGDVRCLSEHFDISLTIQAALYYKLGRQVAGYLSLCSEKGSPAFLTQCDRYTDAGSVNFTFKCVVLYATPLTGLSGLFETLVITFKTCIPGTRFKVRGYKVAWK